jgi:hypothetical protein
MKKTLINELQEYIDLSEFGCMNTVYADILQQEATTVDICLQQAIIYEKCGNIEKSEQLFSKYKKLTIKKR